MNAAQTLIMNAQDALDLAKKNIADDKQHEMVGYNLAQASELFMKAICEMRGIEYPRNSADSHDLDHLMELLEEGGFSPISSHEDVNALTIYNSTEGRHTVRDADRLDLEEMIEHVEDLKTLVGKTLRD
jgi:HEPN domain.